MPAVTEQVQLEHRYRPLGSARELFSCKDPEILLSGPAGTGKSRACLEKLHALCLKYPGMRGVILRKTATSLTSTALVTFREHVAGEAIQSGEVRFFGGSSQEAALFKYGNGSTITVGGMDKSIRIMSSEYDVAYVQEATELSEDDWEAITTRLRHGTMPYQQIIADCNPDVPYHWLKTRCDNDRTRIIYCRHEDNPILHDAETGTWTPKGADYISKLDALTGVRKERLRYGKWAAADGLIYDTFDASIHLWKQVKEPPLEFPRYWSIDFGYVNPFVFQMWFMDNDGRLYMFKEAYFTNRLVEDHCNFIKKNMLRGKRGPEPAPVSVIADHDAEGRATFEREMGVSTTAAFKGVLDGIEAVKTRLKVQADGKPRLYICRDARIEIDQALVDKKLPTCTQEEVLEYAWGKNVSHDRDKIPKEAPRKLNDHGCDAMRYLVSAVDLVGRPGIRTLTWLPAVCIHGRDGAVRLILGPGEEPVIQGGQVGGELALREQLRRHDPAGEVLNYVSGDRPCGGQVVLRVVVLLAGGSVP